MGGSELRILQVAPYNAEPSSLGALVKEGVTPLRLIYDRNHSDIKDVDADKYTVKVDGETERFKITPATLTFKDMQDTYEKKQVTAVLVCAGNRRAKMAEKTGKDVDGVGWGEGTAANVRWAGVPLRELLLNVGVPDDGESWEGLHACFGSSIASCEQDSWYGGSIPLEKAMNKDGDVLLAYEMNGRPLSAAHGFPLRVVVPGISGMRWVKWVDHVTISKEESSNFYQQFDYRVLPASVAEKAQAEAENWWSKVPAMQNLPCNSVIATVKRLAPSCPDEIRLKASGYAYSDCPISSVKISADDGKTWKETRIIYQEGEWSWALWEGEVGVEMDEEYMNAMLAGLDLSENGGQGRTKVRVLSLATDRAGREQALTFPWNLRGVGYSGAGEYAVEV